MRNIHQKHEVKSEPNVKKKKNKTPETKNNNPATIKYKQSIFRLSSRDLTMTFVYYHH